MDDEIRLSHKSDGTPYVRLDLGRSPVTGKRHRPYREFGGMSDEEALEAARVWLDSMAHANAMDSQKLGTMLSRYIDNMEAQRRSYNTVKTYRLYTRRYAAPIARMTVSGVTPSILDELFHDLLANGPRGGRPLSPTTVKKFREYMKGAFRYFVGLGLVDSNPVSDTMPIQAARVEAHALDESDVRTLRGAISEALSCVPDTDLGIMRRNAAFGLLLALNTGARAGEVCALRRRDVRMAASSLAINGTVVDVGGVAVRQNQTKGKKPRSVAVDEATMRALRDHLMWQDGYLGSTGRDTPICTVDGSHMTTGTLSGQFRRYRALLGLDPLSTLHSLRHTHATMLLTAGVDIRTVSERLGHAQVSTTLDTYAHVMEGRDQQAADKFGSILDALK